jgi:hypothetical protein
VTFIKEGNSIYVFLCLSSTRKRGRPKKTWRRSIMEEARKEGKTWREVKRLAADRSR